MDSELDLVDEKIGRLFASRQLRLSVPTGFLREWFVRRMARDTPSGWRSPTISVRSSGRIDSPIRGFINLRAVESAGERDGVMSDQYMRFEDLAAGEKEGVDYRISATDRNSAVAIVAPHGGMIEPGTSQIATAVAADTYSLYCFEGVIPHRKHCELHITSARFNEPRAARLVESCDSVVGIHGRADDGDTETVWMGGGDTQFRDAIGKALEQAGFKIATTGHSLPGREPSNICNRGRRKAGVQLEIPRTLRDRLIEDKALGIVFAEAVRVAIARQQAQW